MHDDDDDKGAYAALKGSYKIVFWGTVLYVEVGIQIQQHQRINHTPWLPVDVITNCLMPLHEVA